MSSPATAELAMVARCFANLVDEIGDRDLLALLDLLGQRIERPAAYATLVGETSTGKSTLANSLVGWRVLTADAGPTTGTVVHMVFDAGGDLQRVAVRRDGAEEVVDEETCARLSREPPEDLLRLRIRVPSSRPETDGLNLIDTPGFNSVMVEHEEVLREFLPQSDVIIFVAGYRSGFGQADQDLLEVVQEATIEDPEIPVLLVVNRTPPGATRSDRRVVEILRNAKDCLHREPALFLVASTTASLTDLSQEPPLPDAHAVWDRVGAIVRSRERQAAVHEKLRALVVLLMDDEDATLSRRGELATASVEETASIQKQIESLRDAREQSLLEVNATNERLRNQVPLCIKRQMEAARVRLQQEAFDSNKWLDEPSYVGYLQGHALPFEVKQVARSVEELIATELDALNRKLEDIANTAVRKIEQEGHLRSDAAARFASSLAQSVAKKVGGQAVLSGLRGLGGVGGAAAGAGNLAKMLVKRIGKMFGKVFGRNVYRYIGRLFTKRFLRILGVAASVLIDTLIYVYDAKTWQKKVSERVSEATAACSTQMVADAQDNHLPAIHVSNVSLVHAIYDDLINEQTPQSNGAAETGEAAAARIAAWRTELSRLRTRAAAATMEAS